MPSLVEAREQSKKAEESLLEWDKGPDFKPVAMEKSTCIDANGIKQSIEAGILLSEKKLVKYKIYKIKAESFETQFAACDKLRQFEYEQAGQVEILYQKRIRTLEREAIRSWMEKNGLWFGGAIGFFAGAAVTILIMSAVAGVDRNIGGAK